MNEKYSIKLDLYSENRHKFLNKKYNSYYYEKIKDAQSFFDANHIKSDSNRWLLDLKWKIPIAGLIFDNILNLKKKKILEVGAGISYFTMELAKKHEYEVIEYSNSKDKQSYRKLESLLNRNFYINNDWCNQEVNSFYDYIIANDLFPNVDQRLDLFIDKYINKCNTLKFLLTYSDNTFFEVRRNSTNETLFWKAWGKYEINNFFTRLFKKYDFIETFEEIQHLISYKSLKDIVFTNHRNCIYVEIKKV